MKISLLVIGKTDAGYFSQGIQEYENRLKHYLPFEMQVIPDIKNVKNLSEEQQKEKRGRAYSQKSAGRRLSGIARRKRQRLFVSAICILYRKKDTHHK